MEPTIYDQRGETKTATSGAVQQTGIVPGPQVPFAVKLLIVAFALSYITVAFYLVVDCWVHEQKTLKHLLGLPAEQILSPIFMFAVYAVLGSILGAGALDIVSFHRYVAVKRDFQQPHVWGYFVAPWLAAVLGLIVFALLQTGLLVFSGGASSSSNSEVSQLGYLTVGFLAGFGWYQAIQKIREVVTRFFASSPQESKQDNLPATPVGQDHQASADGAGSGQAKVAVEPPGLSKTTQDRP